MERLTKWNDKTEGAELISWNEEEWKDFMGSLDVPICTELSHAVEKLAEYEDLEEQGLLLRLPCKVGDTVYSCECGMIVRDFVHSFSTDANGLWVLNLYGGIIGLFGLSVFTTQEEAEAAFAKMKEGV